MLRRFLIALLVFALPVQAALATSRFLCVAMSPDAPKATVMHAHVHEADAHDHGTAHHDGHDTSHDHERGHADGDSGCRLCAACTVTAATPPAPVALAALSASPLRISSPDASVPRIGTEGPERPPRTV